MVQKTKTNALLDKGWLKYTENLANKASQMDAEGAYEPEDCEECGCEAGEFGDEDWDNGHYKCTDCGAVV